MNQVARIAPSADFGSREMALVRKTVAADTNETEFDLFMHTARHLGLDPLLRQIYAFVYNKTDPDKRKMSIVTAIDGFRTIAERTGNYRPDEEAPELHYDPNLVSPSNPLGLVKAVVRVFKFSHGAWHKVTAEAYWEEYAPIKESDEAFDWVETGEFWPNKDGSPGRRPKKKKVRRAGDFEPVLDTSGRWGKNPRGMLPKCAEALALRKAWPDAFAGLYAAEEMDRAKANDDLTASEIAEQGAVEERMARIGAHRALTIDWLNDKPLDAVQTGQFADRVMGFLRDHKDEPSQVLMFQERNRHALREFWAAAPGDALELKKALEGAVRNVPAETQEPAPRERVINNLMSG